MRKPNHSSNRNNYGRNRGGSSNGKYRSNGSGGGNDSQSLGRQKSHAMTQRDKFQAMARDQQANGDRERAEYFLQHVEHYTRVLAEIAEKEALMTPRQQEAVAAENASEEGGAGTTVGNDKAEGNAREANDAHAEPRRTPSRRDRQPRRDSQPRAVAADDNAEEIPLPMDILPDVSSATN